MFDKIIDLKKESSGVTMLLVVIVIASVILAISLNLGLASINQNQISLYYSQFNRLFISADACAEESLIRLSRDSFYTGEKLTLNGDSCSISVSGTGSTRTINISVVNTNYTRNFVLDVIISPSFSITSWQEITN